MRRLLTLFLPPVLARFGALVLLLALAVTARAQTYDLVVAKDGTGNFTSVQAAINAAPTGRTTPFTIFIKNGKYRERVNIPANKPFLQLTGQSVANTIITYDLANIPSFPGNTSTVIINASDITAVNITFENSYGESPQALAMYTTGDRIAFKGCRFTGGQDTVQLNAGTGLRNYFKDCYIDGVVDFIFGSARGVFENCYIYPKTRRNGGNLGYITAANTQPGQPYGFVFRNCTILDNRGTTTYTLGRPWQNDLGSAPADRSATKVVWLNTTMGNTIRPVGWQVWDAGTVTSFITYAEYKSRDFSGALVNVSQRIPWSIQLTDADTANYTRAAVLGNWNPCALSSTFCASAPAPIVVSNFWAVKGSATAPSTLNWNLSWPVAGVQCQLMRSTSRSGTYTPLYTSTNAVATDVNAGTTDPAPAPGTSYFYYVRASKAGLAAHITDTLEVSSTPTVFSAGMLQPFLQGGSVPSAAQNLQVSAENLTTSITVTPPAGFEVSANGTTWFGSAAPLVVAQSSGSIAPTTISVRLNAGPVGAYTGNLTFASAGAATVSIPVTGRKQDALLPQSNVLLWWPMARTNQDSAAVRPAGVQASTPTFRRFSVSSGSAAALYAPYSRTYGQAFAPTAEGGWTAAVGGNGGNLSRTYYEQFTVAPSGTSALRLDSLILNAAVSLSMLNTKLAVVWSRSGFAADSADVSGGKGPGGILLSTASGSFAAPILTTTNSNDNYRLALAGATGITVAAGQRLTIRVYFSCGSGTTTSRFAMLKNVQVKGGTNVVTGTRAVAASRLLQLYPNPAASQCLLVHPAAGRETTVSVYSAMGQRVATVACVPGTQQTALDLHGLAAGHYMVRYVGAEGTLTVQLSHL